MSWRSLTTVFSVSFWFLILVLAIAGEVQRLSDDRMPDTGLHPHDSIISAPE
jgi:hypothetical protein